MGIESVAFLFSKAFWDHDEHAMRTQYYYIVAVILCHNSNSKWRQWCCEKFQKSQFCTQSRQNNISNVRIPFPSWAPQHRLCLWIPVPHSSKSLQLHPGATIYLGKGTPVGIPAPAEGPCDSTWYNGQKKVKSLCQICLTWSQFTLNFSSRKPHIPPLTTSSKKPVYRTFFICCGPGCHTLYISGHPNFMNLSAFLWPSSPGHFFFFSFLLGWQLLLLESYGVQQMMTPFSPGTCQADRGFTSEHSALISGRSATAGSYLSDAGSDRQGCGSRHAAEPPEVDVLL